MGDEFKKFLPDGYYTSLVETLKESNLFSNDTALVIDAADNSRNNPNRWDIFHIFRKTILHLGTVSVATLLDEIGFQEAKAHYEVLSPINYYQNTNPSFVGISSIINNIPESNKRIKLFSQKKNPPLIAAGGSGYFFNPELALDEGADFVVIGKAEYPLPKVLSEIKKNQKQGMSLKDAFYKTDFSNIRGIAYKKDGQIINNGEAPLVKNLDELLAANWNLIVQKYSKKQKTIEDSAGCIHDCDFCAAVIINGNTYRQKSPKRVLDEIIQADKEGFKSVFFIGDHFLARGYQKTKEILEGIRDANLKLNWTAQASVKSIYDFYNRDNNFIKLLEDSKCSTLHLGIEAVTDERLKELNKASTASQLEFVLKLFDKSKVNVHAMMVILHDMSRKEITYTVDFLLKHNVRTAQFFSEIPLPGTKSRQRLLEDHCILETVGENIVDFSKYTGSYVIASKTPYETQRNIRDANRRFYSRKVIFKSFLKATFVNGDYKTFGFRAGMGIISRLQNKFIPALKDYSENLRKKEYTVLSPYISKLKENYLSPLIEKKDKLIQTLKEKKDLYTKH